MKHDFPNLSAINTSNPEGRLLIAALSQLTTTEGYGNKHPDDALHHVASIADRIYKDIPDEAPNLEKEATLEQAIALALNRRNREAVSNTPDFILANYLMHCLYAYEQASLDREKWYGKSLSI